MWSVHKLLELIFLKEYYFLFCSSWYTLTIFMHFIILLFKWESKSPFNFFVKYYTIILFIKKRIALMNWSPWFCNLMHVYTKEYKEKQTAFWLVFKCAHFQSARALVLSLHSSSTLNFHTQNGIANADELINVKSIFFKVNKAHTSYWECI